MPITEVRHSSLRSPLFSSISRSRNPSIPFQQTKITHPLLTNNVRKSKSTGSGLCPKASLPWFDTGLVLNFPRDTTLTVTVEICSNIANELAGASIDFWRGPISLELVSSDGNQDKRIQEKGASVVGKTLFEIKCECKFNIPAGFGDVGAVLVKNNHLKPLFVKNIVLNYSSGSELTLNCNSWIYYSLLRKDKSVFFTKSYLPSKTPSGLKKLREQELEQLRGDGNGERKADERIYDYDVYNDLGNPEKGEEFCRPTLGGSKHPYPRRCRTGRALVSGKEKITSSYYYVPRDENFSTGKLINFRLTAVGTALIAFLPNLEAVLIDGTTPDQGFSSFTKIDELYGNGIPVNDSRGWLPSMFPTLIKTAHGNKGDFLRFEAPEAFQRDKFFWLSDAEFARQTLAGMNPCCIQLVTEWPMKSKLDPKVYGTAESAITDEIVEEQINGVMTAEEAVANKKLFVLDYHDVLVPYVKDVRELEGTTLYASRTLFYLGKDSKLMPIAIELTRPQIEDQEEWRHVFCPASDATNLWLWRLAKAHVLAHDTGYHQLVSHWLRTHCCVEPYVIATNRQLSAMHPIYKLLRPHFRYTMEINALARKGLVNAGGHIETNFFPGKYSLEISSVAYDKFWRFDMEALPEDLIRRGMAVKDPKDGLKLTIEDYPYANDGLLLWEIITYWVTEYVKHYYQNDNTVAKDNELQSWWEEIRTKGHGDKKNEDWWPVLNTINSLIKTLTTIIWVASGHHAAVNFGQYAYAGYMPNRPSTARTNVPLEDLNDFPEFARNPEGALLDCFPTQRQTLKVMTILYLLSCHSPDEMYIGQEFEGQWSEDPIIKAAFERFTGQLKMMSGIIDSRNQDIKNTNRIGVGVVPYKLLKPYSTKSGATGVGVPNSISI